MKTNLEAGRHCILDPFFNTPHDCSPAVTVRRDHKMDPADLLGESDLTRALRLVDWVTHTSNARAKVVGINAIEAILAGNPYLHQVRGFTDLISELHKAREAVQAREVADSAQQQRTTTVPKQPSQLHPPEVSRPDPPEVLPCSSEPSAVGKQRSRRRRFTPQPDSGTTVRPAVIPITSMNQLRRLKTTEMDQMSIKMSHTLLLNLNLEKKRKHHKPEQSAVYSEVKTEAAEDSLMYAEVKRPKKEKAKKKAGKSSPAADAAVYSEVTLGSFPGQ